MYYISAGQTSLLQVQGEFTLGHVLVPEEGWFDQPKYSTLKKKSYSTLYRSLLLLSLVFVKPIRSTLDPTYTSRIIVHGCLLGHYIIIMIMTMMMTMMMMTMTAVNFQSTLKR